MKKTLFFGLLIAGAILTTSQVNAQNGTRNDAKAQTTKGVKTESAKETPSCHKANAETQGKSCCQSKGAATEAQAAAAKQEGKACCSKDAPKCDKAKENK